MPVLATLATLPNLLMLILKGFGDIEALCCTFAGITQDQSIKSRLRSGARLPPLLLRFWAHRYKRM